MPRRSARARTNARDIREHFDVMAAREHNGQIPVVKFAREHLDLFEAEIVARVNMAMHRVFNCPREYGMHALCMMEDPNVQAKCLTDLNHMRHRYAGIFILRQVCADFRRVEKPPGLQHPRLLPKPMRSDLVPHSPALLRFALARGYDLKPDATSVLRSVCHIRRLVLSGLEHPDADMTEDAFTEFTDILRQHGDLDTNDESWEDYMQNLINFKCAECSSQRCCERCALQCDNVECGRKFCVACWEKVCEEGYNMYSNRDPRRLMWIGDAREMTCRHCGNTYCTRCTMPPFECDVDCGDRCCRSCNDVVRVFTRLRRHADAGETIYCDACLADFDEMSDDDDFA